MAQSGIIFKTIKFQNFLATGMTPIEINLTNAGRTLIVGENGAGKSTMLDALCFALFGKAFRNINKPQLPNSINEKDCLVECEFDIGNTEYRVVRGIKPAIFEIYQNDILFNQDSTTRDYQKYLEQNILGLTYKSFTQIVVLGASNFTPFMQLTAADRRDVIEDLLNIQIFSQMNVVLKEWLSNNKQEIADYDHKLDVAEEKIRLQKIHIKKLKEKDTQEIDRRKASIAEAEEQIEQHIINIRTIEDEIDILNDTIKDLGPIQITNEKLGSYRDKICSKRRAMEKVLKFYQSNDSCPTCQQGIESHFKADMISAKSKEMDNITDGLNLLEIEFGKTEKRLNEISVISEQIRGLNRTITTKNTSIGGLNMVIKDHQDYINASLSGTSDTDVESANRLTQFVEDKKDAQTYKNGLSEDRHYYKISEELLKDRGIKSKIIKQYLPVMNKLINKYLQSLDFFVNFNLDENFKETVKSRHRDEFSYNSFSEGQKFRINIAILLAWRDIARMKNSSNTNLLILDEVFDSSLDASGVDEFMKLLEVVSNDKTNVFVISHRGMSMIDKFDSVIEFELKKNFTRMKKVATDE